MGRWKSIRTTLSIYYLRLRTQFKTVLRLIGLTAVLFGAYNMLIVPFLATESWAPYRVLGSVLVGTELLSAVYLGDVALIAVGAVVVWWI